MAAAAVGALPGLGCRAAATPVDDGVLVVSASEQQAAWIRNFNPLLPSTRWPSAAGIHEPLLIYNTVTATWTPWLATGYAFSADARRLTFTIREGVRWSDGRPFSADDVVATFELLRAHPALDLQGLWTELASVERAEGGPPERVHLTFRRPFVPGLARAAHTPMVPKHIWSELADPVRFTNADPVGTGPFTEVRRFTTQVYELGRNPSYWQPGRPAVDAIRMPAFPGNDQVNLALVNGELDWAASFVPAVDRVLSARDAEHFHHWFPLVGTMVFLYVDTHTPPFDDVRVRKALSRAIDRPRMVDIAMFGYTRPADATGLSDAFAGARVALDGEDAAWTEYDPAAAAASLDAIAPRGADGVRVSPGGRRWSFELFVVAGWSDWIRAAQVIARDLRAVGVDVQVRLFDQSAWFDRAQRGEFTMIVGWSLEGPTPYDFYRWLMDPRTVRPRGQAAVGNWHRFGDPEAERLLAAMEATADPEAARQLGVELQRTFARLAPAIPLFPNPAWGEYSTRRFEGFPSAHDPYAALSPNKGPDCLVALTRIRPRSRP
jgi:peptide/nickel transport system substrate-binding protein